MVPSERGAATLEVLVLGVVLIVPLIWLLAVLAEVHRAALATNAAAREVGWEVTHLGSGESIEAAARDAFADHGLDVSRALIRWEGHGGRGEVVVVRASFPVRVATFPLIGSLAGPAIQVEAIHRAPVPAHRSRP